MKDVKKELIDAYNNHLYEYYNNLINDYVKNGYGVDYSLFFRHILSLIHLRRFDEAYNYIKLLENTCGNYPSLNYDIATFYLFCFKPKDAQRVLNNGISVIYNRANIVKIFLMQGKYEEAKKMIDEFLKEGFDQELITLKKQINNHESYNAFIEMDYESFLDNGNELKEGYIVYLKDKPQSEIDIDEDIKSANRPYLIWKCEGYTLYLFPVSTSIKRYRFLLSKSKYPNAISDRNIKTKLCKTTKDNVLSVQDKVLDSDMTQILRQIYKTMYFVASKEEKKANSSFIKSYYQNIKPGNVIEIIDKNTKSSKHYYIISDKDTHYEVVEIDPDLNVLSNRIELFKKDRLVFRVIALDDQDKEKINSQISNTSLLRTMIGARIETYYGRFIVLYSKNDSCICISDPYSPSYINIETINKKDINNTLGFISQDALEETQNLVDRNYPISIRTLLKRIK